MARTAADIMHTDFPFVDCDVTVAEAEECFEQNGLTALPVLNPDRTLFGVLTPQNLIQFYRRPLNNPRASHAWEICDARPLTAAATSPLSEIAGALLESSRSHALIVNDENQLVGMVSTDQLLEENLLVAGREKPVMAARTAAPEPKSR
ncbi:MAG TPA: CBS domain-containing protein [Gammaproteobacteria bacterium]